VCTVNHKPYNIFNSMYVRACTETPMTLCCGLANNKCRPMLLALCAGGAFVAYRNRDGLTPMHRAAEKGNHEALKVVQNIRKT
jgi:ankyrin repeat protein